MVKQGDELKIEIEIGPQELEFFKFFKSCAQDHIRCFNDDWLIGTNELNKDMSVKERCDKIIEYKRNREFCEMVLEWINRVIS